VSSVSSKRLAQYGCFLVSNLGCGRCWCRVSRCTGVCTVMYAVVDVGTTDACGCVPTYVVYGESRC